MKIACLVPLVVAASGGNQERHWVSWWPRVLGTRRTQAVDDPLEEEEDNTNENKIDFCDCVTGVGQAVFRLELPSGATRSCN